MPLTSFRFHLAMDTLVSLAIRFPLSGLVGDLHPLDNAHAEHTKTARGAIAPPCCFIIEIYCSFSVTNDPNQMVRQDNGNDHTMGSTMSNGNDVNRQGLPNNRSQMPNAEDSLA